ncbi:MAG: hypothetical protein EDS66_06145 [Planctomycetota bacterium]|nr:MAG: hypothetical protein EDS66_06145 [Planctomycetota bacterium]
MKTPKSRDGGATRGRSYASALRLRVAQFPRFPRRCGIADTHAGKAHRGAIPHPSRDAGSTGYGVS